MHKDKMNDLIEEERMSGGGPPRLADPPAVSWRTVDFNSRDIVSTQVSTDMRVRVVNTHDLIYNKNSEIKSEDITHKFTAGELEGLVRRIFPLQAERLDDPAH